MGSSARKNHVTFRLNDNEFELLQDTAKKRKLSEGQVARIIILEALAGFDQKQEFFMIRLDRIEEILQLLIDISSLGAAAGALPLDADQHDKTILRDTLKKHFINSSNLGKNIVDMIKKGKF